MISRKKTAHLLFLQNLCQIPPRGRAVLLKKLQGKKKKKVIEQQRRYIFFLYIFKKEKSSQGRQYKHGWFKTSDGIASADFNDTGPADVMWRSLALSAIRAVWKRWSYFEFEISWPSWFTALGRLQESISFCHTKFLRHKLCAQRRWNHIVLSSLHWYTHKLFFLIQQR